MHQPFERIVGVFFCIFILTMETVKLKSLGYYNKNKQLFNKKYNSITKKYINRDRIGSCSYLFLKYHPSSYQEFADRYFDDYDYNTFDYRTCTGDRHYGRSVEQLVCIANRYHQEINNPDITLEQCFDDLINHIIIETYDGHQAELHISNLLTTYNVYEINTGIDDLDAICGVDLVIRKKGMNKHHYIQVKPNTTFIGDKNISLLEDRVNFFKKEKKLQDYLKDNTACIEYMVYDTDVYYSRKIFKFLKINGKFRHRLEDLCNADGTMKINLRYSYFETLN